MVAAARAGVRAGVRLRISQGPPRRAPRPALGGEASIGRRRAMSKRFENRVVLVTGASSGIGRACALALGAEGARVVAAGRRVERLNEVVKSIQAAGGEGVAVNGDVRDQAVCAAWVAAATQRFGGLDGLVNAAGVIGPTGGLLGTEPAEWDRMMDTNLRD